MRTLYSSPKGSAAMKVFVLALCLVMAVGDHDTTTKSDEFCSVVTISINPVIQNCQTLMQSDPDAFCTGNCSQQLAQALHDCGNTSYADVISLCAKDPVNMQYCGSVMRNETTLSALNTSCSGSGNCSTECQTTVDEIGCCVEYIGSDISRSVAQCNVQNCTTIEVNDSGAEALECYRSRLHDNSMLDECHGQLLMTLSLDVATIISFCDGRCPTAISKSYLECGLPNLAGAVANGCERDERGRYCGAIVHQSDFEMLVDRAILACDGTDCTNGVCEAAIDEIGCCLALDAEVNATVSASLPLSQCGVMHCPPFSSAPAIYAVPLMITLGTLFAIALQSP